jgi:hypothetical protein
VTRKGRGYTAVLAAGVLTAAVSTLVAGCASAPADPPQIPPAAAAAEQHQDARITLPVTVGVAFHHPNLSNRAEYAVLFTVQQAMRSMVQAEYSSNGEDTELAEYWSGSGLTAVRAQIKDWVSHQQQPVGMIVLQDTQYTPASGTDPASVSFCADWSHVVRGESRTHVVGAAVQSKGVHPAYEQLTVARGTDKRWRVDTLSVAPNSSKCS